MKKHLFLVPLFFCSILLAQKKNEANMIEDQNKLIAKNAVLKKLPQKFVFTEGPARDKHGDVYFTDQPENKIWKYDVSGKLSLYMQPAGRSNGMFFAPDGKLIACADEHNQLWAIDAEKKHTVLLADFAGKKLNGPNDVWVSPNGDMYFTDPLYPRDYWQRSKLSELDGHKVYLLKKGAQKALIADDKLVKPNGIIGTANGKNLFVADIDDDKTYKYDIAADGTLTNRKLFCAQGSDGMTLDEKGNLYITGKGVFIYDKTGKRIGHIPVPEEWTGNICFAGKDQKTLFITASTGVYLLRMNVRGI